MLFSFQHTTGSWTADPQGSFPSFVAFCSPTLHDKDLIFPIFMDTPEYVCICGAAAHSSLGARVIVSKQFTPTRPHQWLRRLWLEGKIHFTSQLEYREGSSDFRHGGGNQCFVHSTLPAPSTKQDPKNKIKIGMITSDDVNLFNSRNAHGVIVPHHRLYQSVSHPTHSKPNNPPTGVAAVGYSTLHTSTTVRDFSLCRRANSRYCTVHLRVRRVGSLASVA